VDDKQRLIQFSSDSAEHCRKEFVKSNAASDIACKGLLYFDVEDQHISNAQYIVSAAILAGRDFSSFELRLAVLISNFTRLHVRSGSYR
jgi:hypothetical protein